ncbi:hypothetical protein HanIR_Chr10g0454451 [Helianthus annuus]|nr:hypothetical protein HanIR_Chr10g0454451 [Helianthus annuus]
MEGVVIGRYHVWVDIRIIIVVVRVSRLLKRVVRGGTGVRRYRVIIPKWWRRWCNWCRINLCRVARRFTQLWFFRQWRKVTGTRVARGAEVKFPSSGGHPLA